MDGDGSRPAGRPAEPSRVRPFLPAEPEPLAPAAPAEPPGSGSGEVSPLRPYLLTGGRVRPADATLEIEAQVVTTDSGYQAVGSLDYEQRDIVRLCQRPLAVAEVAARLGLHLGVTRVLVGDLVEAGHLAVRRPEAVTHHNIEIIERVIRGLQAID
jgi:hypothetical protein